MDTINCDDKTRGLIRCESNGKFPFDFKMAKNDLKNIENVFAGRTVGCSLAEIYKKQKRNLMSFSDKSIETLPCGLSVVRLQYHNSTIVFDEGKESLTIEFTDRFCSDTGMPKKIVKRNAFPVSLRYADEYFRKCCALHRACIEFRESNTPDKKEKLKAISWLKDREQEMKRIYFSYLIDVGMEKIETFDIRIHLYYPSVYGLEHDSHKAFRKIVTTDMNSFKVDFWEVIKEHRDYTLGIMRLLQNRERYSAEADRLEISINNWIEENKNNI